MSIVLVSQPPFNPLKLRDLDLRNIKAIPYVELCTASLLLPPMLEDVRRYLHFPGPPFWAYILSGALTFGTYFSYDL